ncbi:ABC-type multidrug transport system, ATPase component [Desulfocapsa sulfexigens DSM 10523]|uniref:ABC-type multidrug transport system, ATPase component n=1 Tax=Desulfocapsa sulfexigens (strain DSM 10523 / SB164P1) TaxID=1167006 RepID=M1PH34_DESSD|nr:ABC transporter ATP-binding protein [Desulfocapsa sulfexigens]AGF78930.1 ABC-type multidrug transport system, ATPase component [Desulfocapsa sulfexigens DSM 10523]
MINSDIAPTVVVAELTKMFQERCAVDNISFSIRGGECLGFLGPNGAGKTTTIKMLLGLMTKSSGTITLLGMHIPEQLREAKQLIGVVPQADSLDPDLTVQENLLTYAAFYNIPRRIASAKADELLQFFALTNRKDEVIERLSGGQRRRLLLARALINNPKLLILDEPTVGLDPQSRQLIWQHLEMLQEQGMTMLLTSHYLDEVERLSDRVLILDHGTIVTEGIPQQLIKELVGVDVFEVEGGQSELDTLEEAFQKCNATTERVNDRLYAYTQEDCSRLEALLANSRKWLRRPANLEDLFIQLTGRSLRES